MTTDPGNRPRNLPSSRAIIPSCVSASFVTHTIFVSAFVYWAGSSTKSNASCAVTPSTKTVPSPWTTLTPRGSSVAGGSFPARSCHDGRRSVEAVAGRWHHTHRPDHGSSSGRGPSTHTGRPASSRRTLEAVPGFGRLQAALYDPLMAQAERHWLGALREELVGHAEGETLEIGAGTGLNLPRYRTPRRVVVTEPEPSMLRHLERRPHPAGVPVLVGAASGDALPFPDHSFDTVVSTLVLCSVDSPSRVLAEVRRVLRPGGRYVFLEHGGSHDPRLARWQRRLEPVWKHLAGGCHLTRDATQLVEAGGFSITEASSHEPPRSGPIKPFRLGLAT